MNNLEFIAFYFLFYLLGRSLVILTFRNESPDEIDIFETKLFIFYPIFGVFFVSAIIFIFNFFVPLKLYKNYLTIFLLLLILTNIKNFKFPNNKLFFITNYLVVPFIVAFSTYAIKFHYDSEAYHLLTQSWIINSKIVFGLTKFYMWLGHSSLYEYIQAYMTNNGNFIYQHYLNILFVVFFINFLYFHLISKKDSSFFNVSLFIVIFGILDNFGVGGGSNGFIQIQMVGKPDVGVGILFVLICLFIVHGLYFAKPSELEIKTLFLLLTFIIQLRIMGAALIFLVIPYLYKNFAVVKKVIMSPISAVLITYNLLWLLKNIIVSSCVFFPLSFTCLDSLSWSVKSEIDKINEYYSSWVYSYQFDRSFITFLQEWYKAGHNSTQVPNLLGSLFLIFLIRKIFFNKQSKNYKLLIGVIPILIFVAFFYTSIMRYWYGLILFIVCVLALNIEVKKRYRFIKKSYISIVLLLILSIGYPRGYSYKYFITNFDYYSLEIDYKEYEPIQNQEGFGVIGQNNKCYDVYYCSTFEYSDTKKVNLKKFFGTYEIFDS
jgi:hypothetical protein